MNMHAMNMWLTDAAPVVVEADWTLHPWHQNNVGGVTAGQARHNSTYSSNVGGVTAGQVRHNSSILNSIYGLHSTGCTAVPVAHSGSEKNAGWRFAVHFIVRWHAFLLFRPFCPAISFADVDTYASGSCQVVHLACMCEKVVLTL